MAIVYVTRRREDAEEVVCITDIKREADELVYIVDAPEDDVRRVFITNNRTEADKVVYRVIHRVEATG